MMQGGPLARARESNAVAILIGTRGVPSSAPRRRRRAVLSPSFVTNDVHGGATTATGQTEAERDETGACRGGRTDAIMRVSPLTECVEILDGHTTNKRDPSDDIELRSAGDGRAK